MPLQAKMSMSQPGDAFEQEADRVADQVLSMPANPAITSRPPQIQRYVGHATGHANTATPASVNSVLAAPGRTLDAPIRQEMEHRFSRDFSAVRVHSDSAAEQSARDVGAYAYTVGNHIAFDSSRLSPGTPEGRRLIAHELTHVVQQSVEDSSPGGESNGHPGVSPTGHIKLRRESNSTFAVKSNPVAIGKESFPSPKGLRYDELDKRIHRLIELWRVDPDNKFLIETLLLPQYLDEIDKLPDPSISALAKLPKRFSIFVLGGETKASYPDVLRDRLLGGDSVGGPKPTSKPTPTPLLPSNEGQLAFAKAFIRGAGSDPKLQAHWNRLQGQLISQEGRAKFGGGIVAGLLAGAVICLVDTVYSPLKAAIEAGRASNFGRPSPDEAKELFRHYIDGLEKLKVKVPQLALSLLNEPARWGEMAGHFLTEKIREDIFYEAPSQPPQSEKAEPAGTLPWAGKILGDLLPDDLTKAAKRKLTFGEGEARADHVFNVGFAMGEAAGNLAMQIAMTFIGLEELKVAATALKESELFKTLAGWTEKLGLKPLNKLARLEGEAAAAVKAGEETAELGGTLKAAKEVKPATAGAAKALEESKPALGTSSKNIAAESAGKPASPASGKTLDSISKETGKAETDALKFVEENPKAIQGEAGHRSAAVGKDASGQDHQIVEVLEATGIGCEFQSPPPHVKVRCPTGMGGAKGSGGPAPSPVNVLKAPNIAVQDDAKVNQLIAMWEDRIRAEPSRKTAFRNYIDKLKGRFDKSPSSIGKVNLGAGERLGEQSEVEAQFLVGGSGKTFKTPDGRTVRPDVVVGKELGEVKNWNILYPTDAEYAQAKTGRLPKKLQDLVNQVKARRSIEGTEQFLVIDLRGQFTSTEASAAARLENRRALNYFGKVLTDSTGLPGERITILTW